MSTSFLVQSLKIIYSGGPGCSGLLGFFAEQGPFRPTSDMKLELNAYAWNSVANMVFIESPCGVGNIHANEFLVQHIIQRCRLFLF